MKKAWIALMVALCLMVMTGCNSQQKEEETGYTKEQATQILESGVFTDELDELDIDTAWTLYLLADSGLDQKQLVDGMIYRSAGATCEELALLIFEDDATAATVKKTMEDYVQNQIEANRDYRPGEIPKLEDAVLQQKGSTVLLVVSADSAAVGSAIQ